MNRQPRIHIVVARDRNGVIGRAGDLPWHLPRDLKHFKAITLGHPLLMGRTTHESIGRALPGRRNLVLTRSESFVPHAPAERFTTVDAALAALDPADELMVIGGGQIYTALLPRASCIHLTIVATEVEDGDAHFPVDLGEGWRQTASEEHAADDRHAYAMTFLTLERSRR